MLKKLLIASVISGLFMTSCGHGNTDDDDIISTVPRTNNPHFIVDSNRSPMMPSVPMTDFRSP
jgi:hypothetical protein